MRGASYGFRFVVRAASRGGHRQREQADTAERDPAPGHAGESGPERDRCLVPLSASHSRNSFAICWSAADRIARHAPPDMNYVLSAERSPVLRLGPLPGQAPARTPEVTVRQHTCLSEAVAGLRHDLSRHRHACPGSASARPGRRCRWRQVALPKRCHSGRRAVLKRGIAGCGSEKLGM